MLEPIRILLYKGDKVYFN